VSIFPENFPEVANRIFAQWQSRSFTRFLNGLRFDLRIDNIVPVSKLIFLRDHFDDWVCDWDDGLEMDEEAQSLVMNPYFRTLACACICDLE
jgi:hypothetical protein